jgi:acyl carrier protein
MQKEPNRIINLLAEHLGVEPDDIQEEYTFTEDLHMNPADLADFVHYLKNSGINTETLDLPNLETVNDLIENIESETLTDN